MYHVPLMFGSDSLLPPSLLVQKMLLPLNSVFNLFPYVFVCPTSAFGPSCRSLKLIWNSLEVLWSHLGAILEPPWAFLLSKPLPERTFDEFCMHVCMFVHLYMCTNMCDCGNTSFIAYMYRCMSLLVRMRMYFQLCLLFYFWNSIQRSTLP